MWATETRCVGRPGNDLDARRIGPFTVHSRPLIALTSARSHTTDQWRPTSVVALSPDTATYLTVAPVAA